MAGPAHSDHSCAVLFGLFYGELHSFVSNNLTYVVIAIDHSGSFALAQDLRFLAEVYGSIFDERQILGNARDAMARVPTQFCFHE